MLPFAARRQQLPLKQVGRVRTLDVGGPQLVVNGKFDTDLAGWTIVDSAGGATTWNSGRMRQVNTSGTPRGRQTVTVNSGKRHVFQAQNVGATVAGSMAVGYTGAGSTEYFTRASNPAIPDNLHTTEFTALGPSTYIQVSESLVGTSQWDNIRLRELIPTKFAAGRWFEHDFASEPDGVIDISPDILVWRQIDNGNFPPARFASGKMVVTQNASGVTAAYPYWNFGDGIVTGVRCGLSWTGAAGGTVAMVSLQPSGTLPTTTNITTNSNHIVFTDTKVDIQTYVGGALTTETVNYAAACLRDGTVYPDVGWTIDGDVLTVYLPDGTTLTRSASTARTMLGKVGIAEPFYAAPSSGDVQISKVRMRLG